MTKMQRYQLSALLLASVASLLAAEKPLNEIPSTGEEWMSLADGAEFQPTAIEGDATKQRKLRDAQRRFLEGDDAYSTSSNTTSASEVSSRTSNSELYVDSQNTYYDPYMQSWRYLGFYIDCYPARNLGRRHRRLEDDGSSSVGCQRYLIWAAYVDLDYEGGGIGEYQYYDTSTGSWDENACDTNGNGRCAYMDCHLADTNWSLLGFFKEPEYVEFFEQLFKHQGYCLWANWNSANGGSNSGYDDTYSFMEDNQYNWPSDCTATGTIADGNTLYYDLKPLENGNMTVGLYTDYRCTHDYTGGKYTAKDLLSGNSGLVTTYEDDWNAALGVYKICQPCRSYNLYADGRRKERSLEDDWSTGDNNGYFTCSDDAGYTDVNQCMKFRTKTEMQYLPFDQLVKASEQGGMIGVTVKGVTYGQQETSAYRTDDEPEPVDRSPLRKASVVLGLGVGALIGAGILMRARRRSNGALSEPLVPSSGMIA